MKNCYALFIGTALLLGSSAQIQGQEWFPVGAQWHYDNCLFFCIVKGPVYTLITVEKDTLIEGIACKKLAILDEVPYTTRPHYEYVYADSNRMYYYMEPYREGFGMLLDFNLNVGDTMTVETKGGNTCVKIDSVKWIQVNDTVLKAIHLPFSSPEGDPCRDFSDIYGWAIAGIGFTESYLPIYGPASPPYSGTLRCYQDEHIGLYKHGPTREQDLPCDWLDVSISARDHSASLSLIPNPARQRLRLLMEASGPPFVQLEVYDLRGRRQTGQVFVAPRREWEMSLADWPPGLYVLEVRLLSGQRLRKKLLVQ